MTHDFELKRLTDNLQELHKEQEHLNHNMMRTRRDEQFELDRVRREFNIRVSMIEARQLAITKDTKDKERQLEGLKRRVQEELDQIKEDEREREQERGQRRYR